MTEREKAVEFNREAKSAIEAILSSLNYGQRKKLFEDPAVRPYLDLYKIEMKKE